MLKVENIEVYGFKAAIRGARNPMNSWNLMDSCTNNGEFEIGEKDYDLLRRLTIAGPEHRKWNRMVTVTMDITAPLYWWKEYDTYKVATVANSCSTMHKIQAKEFTLDDFSHDRLLPGSVELLEWTIDFLNEQRDLFNNTKNKKYWWQMIQLLPSSYNQKRTVHLNYETLGAMYRQRRHHKLDEWHVFCDTLEKLPYSEFITMKFNGDKQMNSRRKTKSERELIADLNKRFKIFCNENYDLDNENCNNCPVAKILIQNTIVEDCRVAYIKMLLGKDK